MALSIGRQGFGFAGGLASGLEGTGEDVARILQNKQAMAEDKRQFGQTQKAARIKQAQELFAGAQTSAREAAGVAVESISKAKTPEQKQNILKSTLTQTRSALMAAGANMEVAGLPTDGVEAEINRLESLMAAAPIAPEIQQREADAEGAKKESATAGELRANVEFIKKFLGRAPTQDEFLALVDLDEENQGASRKRQIRGARLPSGESLTILDDGEGNFFTLNGQPFTPPPNTQILTSTNLTGSAEDIGLAPPGSAEAKGFREATVAALTTLDTMDRLEEQLEDSDLSTGLTGAAVSLVDSVVDQVKQVRDQFGGTDDDDVLDFSDEKINSMFGDAAKANAAFRRNIISVAYALARVADPGGRLSNQDVAAQLGSLSSQRGRGQFKAALVEARREMKSSFRNRHSVLSKSVDLPELDPRFAADGGGDGEGEVMRFDKDGNPV